MKKFLLAIAVIASASTSAFAATDIHSKVMSDLLGANRIGATANPTAQPQSGSLADKATHDLPGVTGPGRTAAPAAKPTGSSLNYKILRDQLGA